jgi:hypothetical protein
MQIITLKTTLNGGKGSLSLSLSLSLFAHHLPTNTAQLEHQPLLQETLTTTAAALVVHHTDSPLLATRLLLCFQCFPASTSGKQHKWCPLHLGQGIMPAPLPT